MRFNFSKQSLIALASAALIGFGACKGTNPTGDATCSTPSVAKFLQDGKVAEYKMYGSTTGDTSEKHTFLAVTENIFQQKNTYLNINSTTRNTVPYYFKACGRDIVVNHEAYNMDLALGNENYFVKGDRPVGSTWNFTLNGVKFFCGCAQKNIYHIVPYDTIWVDKIYMRPSPAIATCDTILWNDTIGVVRQYGPTGNYALMKKDY